MVKLTIDGRDVCVSRGTTVLEAAEKAWKAVEARQNEISAKLDAQYEENGKRWAEELARRVLNA